MSELQKLVDRVNMTSIKRLEAIVAYDTATHELASYVQSMSGTNVAVPGKRKYKRRKSYQQTKWFGNKMRKRWASMTPSKRHDWLQKIQAGRRKYQESKGMAVEA